MAFKGKIQTTQGTFSPQCTLSSYLSANQLNRPVIRDLLAYVDKKSISLLLTSGAVGPYGVNVVDPRVNVVDNGKKIGANSYQFHVQGRLNVPSTINSQVGSSGSDGSFSLSLRENILYPGMTAFFNGGGLQARVQAAPTGTNGNYIYRFKTVDGTVFSYATHVAGQGALKTCIGGYSSYGEKSLRGFGKSSSPSAFVVHMTIQRKQYSISGDALSDVLWFEYTNEYGSAKGWRYVAEQQNRAEFLMENEIHKFFGKSSVKADDGTLRAIPTLHDDESGLDITTGDGLMEQLYGGNEAFGSGLNGYQTYSDIADMLSVINQNSNGTGGSVVVCVTGIDGMRVAQEEMALFSASQNVQLVQNVTQSNKVGGASVDVGFNFSAYNVYGNKVVFVHHPLFDRTDIFTAVGQDGKSLQSAQMVFLTMEVDGKPNIEILAKGGNGADRSMVEYELPGPTGLSRANIVTSEDAIAWGILKQDLIVVYNTQVCGIIHKTA